MAKLDGKAAIVTGASSGIGLAIAKAIAADGASVVLAGRTIKPMEEAARQISASGGRAVVRSVDVTDEKSFVALVDGAVGEFGKLDILVNNAGLNPFDDLLNNGDLMRWKETMEVNVLGMALGIREAVRVMKGKTGHIVNITSIAARYSEPEAQIYSASKHAAGALSESVRIALNGQPIRMTAIMPGAVATNLVRNMSEETMFAVAKLTGQDLEKTGWKRGDRVPDSMLTMTAQALKNYVMAPEDVASAVLYALTVPDNVEISEIMIRPLLLLQMPGVSIPA